jgi:hypothetical protein
VAQVRVYFGVQHLLNDVRERWGRMDFPLFEWESAGEYVNKKTFTIDPGQSLNVNLFSSNPRVKMFAIVPTTPDMLLDLWTMKDTPVSFATDENPSNNNRRWAMRRAAYGKPVVLGSGDVTVDTVFAADHGQDGGTGFPSIMTSGTTEPGYWYRILVRRPVDALDLSLDASTRGARVAQAGAGQFTALLIQ